VNPGRSLERPAPRSGMGGPTRFTGLRFSAPLHAPPRGAGQAAAAPRDRQAAAAGPRSYGPGNRSPATPPGRDPAPQPASRPPTRTWPNFPGQMPPPQALRVPRCRDCRPAIEVPPTCSKPTSAVVRPCNGTPSPARPARARHHGVGSHDPVPGRVPFAVRGGAFRAQEWGADRRTTQGLPEARQPRRKFGRVTSPSVEGEDELARLGRHGPACR